MKKICTLILALALMLSLAACGGSASGNSASSATSAPAASGTSSAPPAADASNDPPVTLVVSTAFTATQLQGIFLQYLKDTVEKNSGGSISIDLYTGGTLCGSDEELSMLSDGSIDMMMCYIPANAFNLPDLVPFMYYTGGMDKTYDAVYHVCYDDTDSAGAINTSLEAYHATLLPGFVVSSQQVWVSKQPITCWADMYSGKFGCPTDSHYSDMGYKNLVTAYDNEYYEDLRTGLIDSFSATAADVVNSKYYEVADYFMTTDTYRVGDWLMINTDSLNKLTDNQKVVLNDACKSMSEYAISYQSDLADQFKQIVTDNGGTILSMTQDEVDWYMYCSDILGWKSMIETLGTATGATDSMTTVIDANKEAISQYTGYDLSALEAKYAK